MTAEVLTPLRSEWLALRGLRGRRLRAAHLVRTGRAAGGSRPEPSLVAGVAGALTGGIEPGDLVVADTICHDGVRVPSYAAPLLAGALRRHGVRVHVGTVVTTGRLVDTVGERARLAATGAIAVDNESALLAGAHGRTAVLRAVVDTPTRPLHGVDTLGGGVRALAALRRITPVVDAWAAATGDREVLLAGPRSFCAGVERAIQIVEQALERFGAPVYVRRQIVHNRHVVEDLESRGAIFVKEVDEVPEGAVLVLAAHGVAPEVRAQAARRRLRVIDGTCPLVAKVHQEVRRYAGDDRTVFLIGHHEHEEVVGTYGEAPDHVVIIADPEEAARVEVADPDKVSCVMQTTLAVDEAAQTAGVLRARFPVLSMPRTDDICYATTNRQRAVREIARRSDLVIVIGSQNSSNSQRLAEVAESCGTPARLVDDAEAVELAWLSGARRIGITAGASAPPVLVDELVRALSGLGRVDVREHETVTEEVSFALPKEVAP
jgi:4-hydroxy-3-methylbut-2-enyl diphosphate reductase